MPAAAALSVSAQISVVRRPIATIAKTFNGPVYGGSTRLGTFSQANTDGGASPSVTGTSRLGIVTVWIRTSTAGASGVTWDGLAMTEVTGATYSGTSFLQTFYIINPPLGVSNVVVTSTAIWDGMFGGVAFFTDVNQTTPIDASGTSTGVAATSFSGTATTTAADTLVVDNVAQFAGGGSGFTPATGQVFIQNGSDGAGAWGMSYKEASTAGSVSMGWTSSVSSAWNWGWVSINGV